VGQVDPAFADTLMAWKLVEYYRQQIWIDSPGPLRSLILSAVQLSGRMVQHRWSETQLHTFQSLLGNLDLLRIIDGPSRRMPCCKWTSSINSFPSPPPQASQDDDGIPGLDGSFIDSFGLSTGWSLQNQVGVYRWSQQFQSLIDPAAVE